MPVGPIHHRRNAQTKGLLGVDDSHTILFMRFLLVLLLCVSSFAAFAKDEADVGTVTGYPIPRFVSIRSDEVNVRSGPGTRFPVKWILERKGLPVEVVQEYDTWRKIRDVDGEEGWVQQSMISPKRNAIVVGVDTVSVKKDAEDDARDIAQLEPSVQVTLIKCDETWCEIEVEDIDGFVRKKDIWGIYADERFD